MTATRSEPRPTRERHVWLGQSARTTVVTRAYPELASARWMASLGDAIHRPRMLETVFGPNLKDRLAICGPLMLDSGGFTMMMRNEQLSLDVVARAFGQVNAEVVVSLDYPPLGSDSVDERRAKYSRTFDNFVQLHRLEMEPRLAPVIHGVTTDELQANCAAVQSIAAEPAWVCLGGLVPLLRQSGQLGSKAAVAREELRARIGLVRTSFPLSRLHVLGVGSPRTIAVAFDAGADSVDSIGWRRAAGFGTVFLPGGTERFVTARGRKRAASRLQLTELDLSVLAECGCPACERAGELDGRVETLAGSYLPRAAHNAWVLIGETGQLRNPTGPNSAVDQTRLSQGLHLDDRYRRIEARSRRNGLGASQPPRAILPQA